LLAEPEGVALPMARMAAGLKELDPEMEYLEPTCLGCQWWTKEYNPDLIVQTERCGSLIVNDRFFQERVLL